MKNSFLLRILKACVFNNFVIVLLNAYHVLVIACVYIALFLALEIIQQHTNRAFSFFIAVPSYSFLVHITPYVWDYVRLPLEKSNS